MQWLLMIAVIEGDVCRYEWDPKPSGLLAAPITDDPYRELEYEVRTEVVTD